MVWVPASSPSPSPPASARPEPSPLPSPEASDSPSASRPPSQGLSAEEFGIKASWIRPPVIPTNGIRIKIKPDGSTKGAPGVGGNKPFYIVLNGGRNVGIAARTGAGRKGIKVFSGPSLSQVFDTVRGDVLPAASSEYQAQLLDAMRYLLVKKYPPEAVT